MNQAFDIELSVTESGRNAPKYSLDGDINGEITLKDFRSTMKQVLIETARSVLNEEQLRGFDEKPRVRVDNRFDTTIEVVKPFGKIEYFSRLTIKDSLLGIYTLLVEKSATWTGLYKDSHYVFYNNTLIATSLRELDAWTTKNNPTTGFLRFVNVTPYATRLEYAGISKSVRGKSKGGTVKNAKTGKSRGGTVFKRPNGVYSLIARSARSRYKSIGNYLKFAWMPNGTSGINIQETTYRGQTLRNSYHKGNKKYSGPYVYPSIVIDLNSQGVR